MMEGKKGRRRVMRGEKGNLLQQGALVEHIQLLGQSRVSQWRHPL